jgi:hypothetical protein
MPAFAEDAIKTDDAAKMTVIDPMVTKSTTTTQSDMQKTTAKDGYSGCMHRNTAQMM